ncbi:MAG: hypothetical protein SGBAC_008284 [Bacillariaceae sp.]
MTSTQNHKAQQQRSKDSADEVPRKIRRADESSEDAQQQDALKAIRTMLHREQTSYSIPQNDDGEASPKPFSVFVKPKNRKRMVEWCLAMVGTMELRRETIERAINCIDRFILLKGGRVLLTDPTLYQRATVTALYLIIKCHEEEAIPIEDMAYVCGGGDDNGETSEEDLVHTSAQLAAMETVILTELQWTINPPTSYEYMAQFLKLLNLPVSDQFDLVQDECVYEDEDYETASCSDAAIDSESKWLLDLAIFEVEQNLQDYDCWKKGAFHNAYNAIMNGLPMLDGGKEMAERLATLLSSEVPDLESYRSTADSASNTETTSTTSRDVSSPLSIVVEESVVDKLPALDDCSVGASSDDDSASTASSVASSVADDEDVLPEEPLERLVSISYIAPGSTEAQEAYFNSQHTRSVEMLSSQHTRAEMFSSVRTRSDHIVGNLKLDEEDNESPSCVMDSKGLSTIMQTSLLPQSKDLLED